LIQFPNGKHILEALTLKEKAIWDDALKTNSEPSFSNYISIYPNGKYATEALRFKEEFAWGQASKINTLEAYSNYLSLYPNRKYASLAEEKVKELKPKVTILGPGTYTIKLSPGEISEIYQIHPSSPNGGYRYTVTSPSNNYEVWFTDGEKVKGSEDGLVKWRSIPEFKLFSQKGDIVTIIVR
jgi:hypothetical protein